MSYVSGFLLAVPEAKKDEYAAMARKVWEVFRDNGALYTCECWGADVPDGKVTSFPMAVKKKEDEVVVFSWIEWPDRATCDKAMEAMMEDERLKDSPEMPFDGMRMMWGGFDMLFDSRN